MMNEVDTARLEGREHDYMADYRDWWQIGGRPPRPSEYGLTSDRAEAIANAVREEERDRCRF